VKTCSKGAAFAAVLFVCAVTASANSVDPGIIIRDPRGCPSGGCINITGLTFGFAVPEAGFGVFHFLNASGVTWTTLILTELAVPAVNVTCSSDAFSCSVVALGQMGAKIVLTAAGGLTGIPNGNSFELVLGCARGNCDHWPGGLDFDAVANPSVPEPQTMLLMLAGVAAIFMRVRQRKAAGQLFAFHDKGEVPRTEIG
jgi:PEP-CTERM motif